MRSIRNADDLCEAIQSIWDEEEEGGLREFDRDSVFFVTKLGEHVTARHVIELNCEYHDATNNPGTNEQFRIVSTYIQE